MAELSSPLRRLLAYARPYRGQLRLATLFSILNKIFDLAPPALIGAAIDVVDQSQNSLLARVFGFEETSTQLWILSGLTVLIWVLESVFEYALGLYWRGLAQTLQHDLRSDVYSHVQTLEMGFFEERRTGGLMAILNDDVNQLERFLDNGANSLLQVATTVLVVGGAFFWIEPRVAWVAMLPMPFILWGSVKYQKLLAPRYGAVREDAGLLGAELQGNLEGIATIKSFTAEAQEAERIEAQSAAFATSNRRAIKLSSAFSPLIRMLILLGFGATLFIGGTLAADDKLAVGAYSVLIFLTQRLLWPLTSLGATFDLYQRAMASTTRILNLLETKPRILAGTGTLTTPIRGAVRYAGVGFAYPERRPVFEQLDLDLPAGETNAIVGTTGSGKSTLAKLLLRFYEPTAGRITIDGQDIANLTFESLRGAIGLVSQEVFLFHGTVAENIGYGRPNATRAEIEAAAQAAEATEFVATLPQGFDTLIGERGQKLSGGQRQRLSIARAVLKDPPILVLDEATSAVDNETEAAIQRSLAKISVGRTTLVIAHRLSTVRHAARISVIEGGCIAESGTHEELLQVGGLYAQLWRVQSGEGNPV